MASDNSKIERQRAEAFERLEQKIGILEKWLDEGIPYKLADGNKQLDDKGKFLLEYFPTSVRGLRLWNGTQNSKNVVNEYMIPHYQTSDATWKAASFNTKIRVEGADDKLSLFVRLKEIALIQRSNKQKTKIQELEEKLELSETNKQGLATELIQLRLDNKFLESELRNAENKLQGAQEIMRQQLEFEAKKLRQLNNEEKALAITVNKLKELLHRHSMDYSDIEKETSVITFPGVKSND
jgi:hypothetical protein